MASARARAAFSLSEENDEGYDLPRNDSTYALNTSSAGSSMSDGSDALQRLQTKLTTAIEHMECAQLEFFHVNRAFEAHKKQEQQQQLLDNKQHGQQQQGQDQGMRAGQLPWSVKVQLYCEFWQQFMTQLREALLQKADTFDGPDTTSSSNEQSLKALSLLASNVWGETRASPQEVFKNGPIVLSPQQGVQHQPKLKSKLKLKPKQTDALVRKFSEQRLPVSAAAAAVPTVFNSIGPHLEVSNWIASSTTSSVKTKKGVDNGSKMASTNGGPRKKAKIMKTKASTTAAVSTATADTNGGKRNTALSTSNGSKDVRVLSMGTPPRTAAVASGAKVAAAQVDNLAPRRYLSTKPLRKSKSGRVLGRFVPRREHTRANVTAETNTAKASIPESTFSATTHSASTTTAPSPLRKKKITTRLVDRKRFPVPSTEVKQGGIDDDEDGNQAELLLIPVKSATSEAIIRIKEEIAVESHHKVITTAKLSTSAKRNRDRYLLYARFRHRIQGQLGSNEKWPDLAIPFPAHLLIFDPKEHPQLVNNHRKFWTFSVGAYVEMVFYHPQAEDLVRVAQGKVQLRKRQRGLLSEYIEILGVREVAQRLHKQPKASFAFFFAKTNIRLDELSSKQLDAHLSFLREPWKSPTAQEKQFSWWETLYTTSPGKPPIIQISEAAKQQIARAHFRGELDFDENWLRFANESPWIEMLDELRVAVATPAIATTTTINDSEKVDDNDDEHDFPQSPPRRKKIARKVPVNRESVLKANDTSSKPAERLHLSQQQLLERAESSSSSSTGTNDDDDFIEQPGGRRIKLGKRLRTSK